MRDEQRIVKAASADLDLNAKLRLPVQQLDGVSPAAASVLAKAAIKTIFDLGASNLFARAKYAAEISKGGSGLIPGDLLTATQDVPPKNLGELAIANLQGLGPAIAGEFSKAMGVETLDDLANWPPYVAANSLVRIAMGDSVEDGESGAESLRPKFGQYPTERVYFDTLSMFQSIGAGGADRGTELMGAISLAPAVQANGLSVPAIGALLSFSQSWIAEGITLGHMLHALALAPGEATRIAVVDWSRRTSASASESITEAEQLDNAALHARSISEVQSAVAKDMQSGGSRSSNTSESSSTADASASGSGLLQSLMISSDVSNATQSASSTSDAFSTSWSMGTREVMASMSQNINDRTEQHATSVRNRRATAIREVAQSEHESVSSRVVANYNHMHALTVQYYEVVQVYRVVAALERIERCIFLPVESLDFSEPNGFKAVERFRGALIRTALTARIRSLLADDTTSVEITPLERVRAPRPEILKYLARQRATAKASAAQEPRPGTGTTTTPPPPPPAAPPLAGAGFRLWSEPLAAAASRILNRPLFRAGSDSLFVPDEAEIVAIGFSDLNVKNLLLDRVGAGASADLTITVAENSPLVDVPAGIRFADLESLSLSKKDEPPQSGTITLHGSYLGRRFSLPDMPVSLKAGLAFQRVATFRSDEADRRGELLQHLSANRDYYTQAICRLLDSGAITGILSRHRLGGKPLIEQVEPKPLATAGNYLIFRAPVGRDEASGLLENGKPLAWGEVLKRRGVEPGKQRDERLIPIPTQGVFAEAVLGRSNAAEKLDLTRFWNWQDSPIPIVPSEIQPQSRATVEDIQPGQLSSPVLNIMNPTPLPDPAGVGAALNALTSLNFRDMSGLAGTQAVLQAAQAAVVKAATDAGGIAGQNLATEAQKSVAMAQTAADVIKAALPLIAGGPGLPGAAGKSLSGVGAAINHARDMDERGVRINPSETDAASSGTISSPDGGSAHSGGAITRHSSRLGGTNEGDVSRGALLGGSASSPGSIEGIVQGFVGATGTMLPVKAPKAGARRELTLIAEFSTSYFSDHDEAVAIDSGVVSGWHPWRRDFEAGALDGRVGDIDYVRSFEEFQCNILKYSGTPLSRLNLLTHASPIEFALSGHVTRPTDLAPGECRFGNAVKEADLDALSADMKKKLQACFTKDAEIYIYGCWAGGLPDPGTGSFLMRPELLQKVANTFQVVTDGPDVEIYWFCAFLSGDGHKDSAGTEKDLLERGYSALGNVPVGNAAAVRPAFKDSKKGFRHLTLKTKKAPVKP